MNFKLIKKVFIFLYFVGLCASSYSQNKDIDVILIGGQSNATGQGYMQNIPEKFKIDTTVLIYYSRYLGGGGKSLTWQPLCQASETPDRFGIELSLGTELQRLYPNKKFAIIKHALSGANLYEQWNSGTSSKDTINFGEEYKKFINTVENGLEALRVKEYKPKIRVMAWQQGEGDARDIAGMENSRNYGENLNRFIKRTRKDLKVRQMLFVYGYVIPVPLARFTGREEVREAQRKIDQYSGDKLSVKRAFVLPTDDLQLRRDDPNSPYPNDVVHFGTAGILQLGKRFAEKIYKETK